MAKKKQDKLRGFAELVISSYYFNMVRSLACLIVFCVLLQQPFPRGVARSV